MSAGEQALALRGQHVVVTRRVLGIGPLLQHPVVDEPGQAFGQRPAADAELTLKTVEAGDAARDVANDQERPPVADHAEGLRDTAVGVG